MKSIARVAEAKTKNQNKTRKGINKMNSTVQHAETSSKNHTKENKKKMDTHSIETAKPVNDAKKNGHRAATNENTPMTNKAHEENSAYNQFMADYKKSFARNFSRLSSHQKEYLSELAERDACKLVTWWHLGLPPVNVECYSFDNNGELSNSKRVYGLKILNDGQYTLWAMADYVQSFGSGIRGYVRCAEKLDEIRWWLVDECHEDTLHDDYEGEDFDHAIYAGLKFMGHKTQGVCDVVTQLFNAMPLTPEGYDSVKWVCEAYYLLADTIVQKNKDKVEAAKKLFLENGLLDQGDVADLFKEWSRPEKLNHSVEWIEENIGRCPPECKIPKTLDLTNFSFGELPFYANCDVAAK